VLIVAVSPKIVNEVNPMKNVQIVLWKNVVVKIRTNQKISAKSSALTISSSRNAVAAIKSLSSMRQKFYSSKIRAL
jgi:hypothetical protein